jgi:glycosyltransferase involved in cell wall biosynthesis
MNPAVSILIPAFNQDLRLLKECVDSALAQTFKDIEVVVSDNHSTNGSAEVLRSYTDQRLRVVSPPSFLSMNDNFAFCASYGRGKYLSFLSSDDLLLPHAIEVLHRHIESDPNMIFGCGNVFHARRLPSNPNATKSLIRSRGTQGGVRFYKGRQAQEFFFPWTMASTWMAGDIIRRDAYERTGGFSKCDLLTTGDVWITKSLLEYGGFFCLDEPIALFRARALLGREVDRDRKLFDFADSVKAKSQEIHKSHSRFALLRQRVSLAYRIGAKPCPSEEAIASVRSVLEGSNRLDLVGVVDLFEEYPTIFRAAASALYLLDVARKAGQQSMKRIREIG